MHRPTPPVHRRALLGLLACGAAVGSMVYYLSKAIPEIRARTR